MREISSKSRLVIALLLMTSAAVAQGWTAVSVAPEGYSRTPGAADGEVVYTRRFRQLGASHRLRQNVLTLADVSARDYLSGATDEGESLVEGSAAEMPLVGRSGRRLTFRGTRRLRGKMMNTLRTLTAVRIDDDSMLVVESTLAYTGDDPPRKLRAGARNAVLELVRSLEVKQREPSQATSSGNGGQEKRRYSNDAIAPFSFEYPSGWYVAHDDVQMPGSLWVIATPEERTAVSGALEDVKTALRVTLVGHVTAMLGAENELDRAVDFVVSGRAAGGSKTFTVVGDTLLGAAKGRLLRYGTAEIPQQGLLLVGVAETTVIVAEFLAHDGMTPEIETLAVDMLNSMRLEVERARVDVPASGPSPAFSLPASWTLETVPAPDGSRALVLGSGSGTEVVVRSLATRSALDEAALRDVLARVVADDLSLTTRDHLSTAERRHAPLGDIVIHVLVASPDGTTDVYGIATANRVHVCFVDVAGGNAGRDYGLALGSLLTWNADRGAKDGRKSVPKRVVLRHHAVDSFDAGGHARAATTGRLLLEPDGTLSGKFPGTDDATAVQGRHEMRRNRLVLEIGAGRTLTLVQRPEGGWRDSESGRIFHVTPDLD